MKTAILTTLAIFTLSLSVAGPAAALSDNQIISGAERIGHVSLGTLKSACGSSGGSFIETPDEYMCATDNSWIYCEKGGDRDCVGENTSSKGKTGNHNSARLQKNRATLPTAATIRPGPKAGTPAKKAGAALPNLTKKKNDMALGVIRKKR